MKKQLLSISIFQPETKVQIKKVTTDKKTGEKIDQSYYIDVPRKEQQRVYKCTGNAIFDPALVCANAMQSIFTFILKNPKFFNSKAPVHFNFEYTDKTVNTETIETLKTGFLIKPQSFRKNFDMLYTAVLGTFAPELPEVKSLETWDGNLKNKLFTKKGFNQYNRQQLIAISMKKAEKQALKETVSAS
jgi:phage pi2 protein 07